MQKALQTSQMEVTQNLSECGTSSSQTHAVASVCIGEKPAFRGATPLMAQRYTAETIATLHVQCKRLIHRTSLLPGLRMCSHSTGAAQTISLHQAGAVHPLDLAMNAYVQYNGMTIAWSHKLSSSSINTILPSCVCCTGIEH